MKIGVAGSMHHTEKMMELRAELESIGHTAFISKSEIIAMKPIVIHGDLSKIA
jgi:hypothetical protein